MNRELQVETILARRWQREAEEAARLSKLVHDGMSQQVAALKLGLAALGGRLRQANGTELVSDVDQLRVIAGDLMTSVTHLVDELQPPMLQTLGLEAAVRWKVHRYESRLGFPVKCQLEPANLPGEAAAALYQVLSEGLENIRLHAQASSAEVRLEQSGGEVRLTMSDSGRGFDATKPGTSLGLLELAMRMEQAGGRLKVTSRPGQGCRVEASVPASIPESPTRAEQTIQVLIADDHPIVRRGLRQILAHAGLTVDEVATIPALRAYLSKRTPDVLLLDINMPGGNGIEMVGEIKRRDAKLPVLVLSVHREEDAGIRAMLAGARGYLNKDTEPEQLLEAVRRLHQGGRFVSADLSEALAEYLDRRKGDRAPHEALSARELTVLKMIAAGRTTADIAAELNVSPKTVATYRSRIIEKMRMKSTAEMTRYVIENGLI